MKSPTTNQSGFTLIELLIALVVLGVVAAIAIVALSSALDKSKQRASISDIRSISRAIEAYAIDNSFPSGGSGGLTALVPVLDPYYSSVVPTRDHWNHVIVYSRDVRGNYTIESYGKDGIDGTDLTAADPFAYDNDIVLANGMFTLAVN